MKSDIKLSMINILNASWSDFVIRKIERFFAVRFITYSTFFRSQFSLNDWDGRNIQKPILFSKLVVVFLSTHSASPPVLNATESRPRNYKNATIQEWDFFFNIGLS